MKKFLTNIISAQSMDTKIAKSLLFASIISVVVAFYTVDITYYFHSSRGRIYRSAEWVENNEGNGNFIKVLDYNEVFILISFIAAAALAYLIVKKRDYKLIK
jgi:hypothetical protein